MQGKYKSRYKRKRKSVLRRRWFWDTVLGVLFAACLGYLLFWSPLFEIDQSRVKIFSIAGVNESWLKALIEKGPQNLLLFNKGRLSASILENFSQVKAVRLGKEFPHSFILELEPRKPALYVCSAISSTDCCLIDNRGVRFEIGGAAYWQEQAEQAVWLITDEEVEEQLISKILKINKYFENVLRVEVLRFELGQGSRLDAQTKAGWQVYFDFESDLDLALIKLNLLLEKEIDTEKQKTLNYIDLRFNKAYYR